MQATLHRLQLCAPQPGSASTNPSRNTAASISQELNQMRGEVQELIKFVALNYLAVVKAIKKRNRHLKVLSQRVLGGLPGSGLEVFRQLLLRGVAKACFQCCKIATVKAILRQAKW